MITAVHTLVYAADPERARAFFRLLRDDINGTVADLEAKGVEFTRPVRDDGFGLTTDFIVPGGGEMHLDEPRHPKAYDISS